MDALFAKLSENTAKAKGRKQSKEWLEFIADLDEAEKASTNEAQKKKISEIRARAEARKYHDFSDESYVCSKSTLAEHLNQAGLVQMANNTMIGKYDF